MGKLREILLMEEGLERDNLAKKYGLKIESKNYSNRIPDRFSDEKKSIWIPMDPENKYKSEKIITDEHEYFFYKNKILFFHTKVKGEVQSIGNGHAVLKKSPNVGFFDMILIIKGKTFVGLELKAGRGGYWSIDQMRMHDRIIEAGGYALVSNSVTITEKYLKENNLI